MSQAASGTTLDARVVNAGHTEPTVWRARLLPALLGAAARFGDQARRCPLRAPVPTVPGWTTDDVVAHVAADAERNLAILQGRGGAAPTADAIAAMNRDGISARGSRPREQLLEELSTAVTGAIRIIDGYGDGPPPVLFDGGVVIRSDFVLAVLLGELVVHGYDLARASGSRWPISAEEASLVSDGALDVMDAFKTPRAQRWHGTIEVRVRQGTATRFTLEKGGRIRSSLLHQQPDAVLSATGEALLLTSYGRRSPLPFVATGRLGVWGRRPWLAAILPALVAAP